MSSRPGRNRISSRDSDATPTNEKRSKKRSKKGSNENREEVLPETHRRAEDQSEVGGIPIVESQSREEIETEAHSAETHLTETHLTEARLTELENLANLSSESDDDETFDLGLRLSNNSDSEDEENPEQNKFKTPFAANERLTRLFLNQNCYFKFFLFVQNKTSLESDSVAKVHIKS